MLAVSRRRTERREEARELRGAVWRLEKFWEKKKDAEERDLFFVFLGFLRALVTLL
jgi:hypothetical protein